MQGVTEAMKAKRRRARKKRGGKKKEEDGEEGGDGDQFAPTVRHCVLCG